MEAVMMTQTRNGPEKAVAAGKVLRVGLTGRGRQEAWATTSVVFLSRLV